MKDYAVVISEDKEFRNLDDENAVVDKLMKMFASGSIWKNETFRVSDMDFVIEKLFSQFRHIRAGGGFVINEKDQLLVIKRRGVWDLPKGKIEANENSKEAAIREVMEECGVDSLEIISEPFSTFHLYTEQTKTVIKESIWYKMKCGYGGSLIPQLEEEITQVEWRDLPISVDFKTYPSIVEVLDHFSEAAPISGSSTVGG